MATQLDILDAFHEEMQSLLTAVDSSSLSLQLSSSVTDHVGLRERYQRSVHPFIAFERNGTPSPLNRGLGDNRTVIDRQFDANGNVTAYVYRQTYRLELTITVLVDENDTRTLLALSEKLRDRIENYGSGGTKPLTALHPDIRRVTLQRTFDASRVSENTVGQSMMYRVRYDKLTRKDVDAMEDIDVAIIEDDTDTVYYDP